MLSQTRRQKIAQYVQDYKTATVQDLVQVFDSSEATIRRDLKQLEEDKQITRVHGGAIAKQNLSGEDFFSDKLTRNAEAKARIGAFAASLVSSGETIYLDAGTTTRQMIAHLPQDILVVTNSLSIANQLGQHMIETIIIGGKVKQATDAIVGHQALKQLEDYHFSKAFMGVNAIDLKFGMTTPDSQEAAIKQQAMQQSLRIYHLADASKFDQVTFAAVNPLDVGSLITVDLPDALYQRYHNELAMKVVTN